MQVYRKQLYPPPSHIYRHKSPAAMTNSPLFTVGEKAKQSSCEEVYLVEDTGTGKCLGGGREKWVMILNWPALLLPCVPAPFQVPPSVTGPHDLLWRQNWWSVPSPCKTDYAAPPACSHRWCDPDSVRKRFPKVERRSGLAVIAVRYYSLQGVRLLNRLEDGGIWIKKAYA